MHSSMRDRRSEHRRTGRHRREGGLDMFCYRCSTNNGMQMLLDILYSIHKQSSTYSSKRHYNLNFYT